MAIAENKIAPCAAFNGTTVSVDYATYLSQHDVVYNSPPRLGEQGMPIGDGDLGAMVWCPPGEIRLQINKSDLWWENTPPKPGRWEDWQRLSAGTLILRTDPSPLEEPTQFEQRLSLFQAQVNLKAGAPGGDCQADIWVAATGSVLCVQYSDHILRARNRMVELKAWREARPFAIGNYIGLVEALPDRRYALVCRVIGQPAQSLMKDAHTAQIEIPSERGARFTLFAAVGVSDRDGDPVTIAKTRLEAAITRSAESLAREHKMHWHAFWQKSFLRLTSPDGDADYLENLWYFNLYQLASCSRGLYVPAANGGLWLADSDARAGGAGLRHSATQALYWPTFASNHLELTHTYFETYFRMFPVVLRETMERFFLSGARFPEVVNRHGEDITDPEDPMTRLILSSGLECAMLYWWCWEYARDRDFLRERAYPMLRACVEFYLHCAKPEPDGTFALFPSNAYENRTGVKNAPNDLAALRFGLKALLEASEELSVDEEERPRWQEFLNHLPAYPILPDKDIWSEGCGGTERIGDRLPELAPVFPSGEVGIGSPDYDRAVRTFHENDRGHNRSGGSLDLIHAARLGLREEMSGLLSQFIERFQLYPQGFCHRAAKAYNDRSDRIPYLEPLGVLSTALNEVCVQGRDGVIRVFAALPPGWDGTFMLRAAGGFNVMAETVEGAVMWVAVQSFVGGRCRLANPWPGETARALNGRLETLRTADPILEFQADKGQLYVIDRPLKPLWKMPRLRLSGKRRQGPRFFGMRQIGLSW